MYGRIKQIASIIHLRRMNFVRGPGPLGAIGTLAVLTLLATSVAFASHEDDKVGGDPKGTFSADPLIVVSNSYKVGRRVEVDLSGNASDMDCHWNGTKFEEKSDTFDGANAYKWVISNLSSTSPLNLTGQSVDFTTKNSLGSGDIIMKVKDDGVHYQDLTTNTQVASIKVHIVDPDGVRIVSQNGSIVTNDANEVATDSTVVFQVT